MFPLESAPVAEPRLVRSQQSLPFFHGFSAEAAHRINTESGKYPRFHLSSARINGQMNPIIIHDYSTSNHIRYASNINLLLKRKLFENAIPVLSFFVPDPDPLSF